VFMAAAPQAGAQNPVNSAIPQQDVGIGVEEHLGDTIPLNLTFYNENKEPVTLGKLIDKPTILCFVYFDCPGLCSPLLSGVSEAIKGLDMELGTDYQVITISFNTNDSPEKAQMEKQNFTLSINKEQAKYWYFLTGDQASIDEITKAIGYIYKPQGVDFAHPSVIMMISPSGKITRYLYGLTYLPFDVKMAIIEAQKGISRPSINKVLELCFAYNPSSNTYTLQVTRIFGALIIFIALLIFIPLIIKKRKKLKTAQ